MARLLKFECKVARRTVAGSEFTRGQGPTLPEDSATARTLLEDPAWRHRVVAGTKPKPRDRKVEITRKVDGVYVNLIAGLEAHAKRVDKLDPDEQRALFVKISANARAVMERLEAGLPEDFGDGLGDRLEDMQRRVLELEGHLEQAKADASGKAEELEEAKAEIEDLRKQVDEAVAELLSDDQVDEHGQSPLDKAATYFLSVLYKSEPAEAISVLEQLGGAVTEHAEKVADEAANTSSPSDSGNDPDGSAQPDGEPAADPPSTDPAATGEGQGSSDGTEPGGAASGADDEPLTEEQAIARIQEIGLDLQPHTISELADILEAAGYPPTSKDKRTRASIAAAWATAATKITNKAAPSADDLTG